MTDTTKTGGPAFPFAATDQSNVHMQSAGMTLRDWFAGQALSGYLSKDFDIEEDPSWNVGRLCYAYADAMISARGDA